MRISVSADELTGVAGGLVAELGRRGHEVLAHGVFAASSDEREDWAWASEAVARDVAEGRAQSGIVCCWTGTGASIAANKVAGVRAALCLDAPTAAGARTWNDANVLALSLRATSEAELTIILVPHRATLAFVPTTRPRHTITETAPVQEALDELRAKLNGDPIDFAELVVLGARAKARRLPDDNAEARKAREEVADWILNGTGPKVDIAAAEEVKYLGLIANYDE